MSRPILQLQNGANWTSIWNYSAQALEVPNRPGFFFDIPSFNVPFLLENHVIAMSVTSATARPRWKVAGTLTRKISTGIVTGGSPDASVADNKVLYLDRINLFNFVPYTATYALEVSPKYWLKDISVNLWIYTGVDSDTVTEQLDRIELAIDGLNL